MLFRSEQGSFFFDAPTKYDEKTVRKRWEEDTPQLMTDLIEVIEGIEDFSSENLETVIKEWIKSNEHHMGKVMNAFRLSLVGAPKGPHIYDISALLGKQETIDRLQRAITTIN